MNSLLNDIVGHGAAKKMISTQIKSGEFSHAYLIVGKKGVGKRFFSKTLAKIILAEASQYGKDKTLLAVENGTHPDLMVIDSGESIKIDEVRDLIERINLSPIASKKKVALIIDSHKMGIEASNALLKTLEEPPLDCVLILTSISEENLPKTVLSRVQKIKLGNLNKEEIGKILEARGYSPDELSEICELSNGAVGEVVKMAENKGYIRERKEIAKDVETFLISGEIIERFMILDKYEKSKSIEIFLDLLATVLLESLKDESAGFSKKIKEKYETGERVEMCKNIIQIKENLNYNINLRMAMEGLILESQQYD